MPTPLHAPAGCDAKTKIPTNRTELRGGLAEESPAKFDDITGPCHAHETKSLSVTVPAVTDSIRRDLPSRSRLSRTRGM